jgi:hypothetical protein
MAIIETALISALAPAAVDMLKGLFGGISRRIGGLSVDDEIKLGNANVAKLEALSKLDSVVGTPSQWVVDVRASFRYIAAGVSILGGLVGLFVAPTLSELWAQLITIPFSFIFGERMYLQFKGK